MAHPRKPPYKRKSLANVFYTDWVIANFVPNFAAIATGVGEQKCDWQHSVIHPWNPALYRRKNLADISYTNRVIAFLSQILLPWQRGSIAGKCDRQHLMAHPETPYRRKNLADIFYTDRVMAKFVPNFVAMATGVGRGKMRLAAFRGACPKTPL